MIESVAYRAVPTDRAYYLRELVSAVVGQAGLSPQAEADMRQALTAQIDPLPTLADRWAETYTRHVNACGACVDTSAGCWRGLRLSRMLDRLGSALARQAVMLP